MAGKGHPPRLTFPGLVQTTRWDRGRKVDGSTASNHFMQREVLQLFELDTPSFSYITIPSCTHPILDFVFQYSPFLSLIETSISSYRVLAFHYARNSRKLWLGTKSSPHPVNNKPRILTPSKPSRIPIIVSGRKTPSKCVPKSNKSLPIRCSSSFWHTNSPRP